jgi:iron(III) transport system substrate-binding protein
MHDAFPQHRGAAEHRNALCRQRLLPVRAALALLTACASALLCGCSDEPEVVAYVSADDHVARLVLREFEKQSGITVRLVGDSELNKTIGLVQRLRNESNNPQADVFWSSEVFMTIQLADEGVLAPYASPNAADWPKRFVDEQHRWYGMAARARVIVYNPQRVEAEAVPETWMDLTDPRFRGRIVMADPRFGTTGGHLGAMRAYWSARIMPQYYEAFIEGLAANEVRLLSSGNAGVVELVATGEADVGMTDTDDVWAATRRGFDVAMVYARHEVADERGTGTLLIPNTVGLVRGGPNPEAAKQLIDFMLSEHVERLLAESVSHNTPIRPGLADSYPELVVLNPLDVSFAAASAERESAVSIAMQWLGEQRTAEAGAGER